MDKVQQFRKQILSAFDSDIPPQEKVAALMQIQVAIVRYQESLRRMAEGVRKDARSRTVDALETLCRDTVRLARMSTHP